MIPAKKIILVASCVFCIVAIIVPVLIYAFRTANIKDFPSLSGELLNGDIFFSSDIDFSKNTVTVFFVQIVSIVKQK